MTDRVICPSAIEEAVDNQAIIKSITFLVQNHSPTLGILGSNHITVPLGTVSVPGLRSKMM